MVLILAVTATLLAVIFSASALADLVRLHRRLSDLEDRWRGYRSKAALWDLLQDADIPEQTLQIPEQRGNNRA